MICVLQVSACVLCFVSRVYFQASTYVLCCESHVYHLCTSGINIQIDELAGCHGVLKSYYGDSDYEDDVAMLRRMRVMLCGTRKMTGLRRTDPLLPGVPPV